MKHIFSFIALCLVFNFLQGQNSLSKKNAGSAKELKGEIYTLVCFISEEGQAAWSTRQKDSLLAHTREALHWIDKQAKAQKIDIKFTKTGVFGREEDIKFSFIEKGSGSATEKLDWVSQVLYKVGYQSTLDFHEQIRTKEKADQIHVIIFAKGKGRSYAIPYLENANKELYFVEGTIIFEKVETYHYTASIAHEILHLYGAIDLYKTHAQSAQNAQKARNIFPKSIMTKISHNIHTLNIDEINSWLIGWSNETKPWYDAFLY